YGPNRLPPPRRRSLAGVVIGQFRSPFIYLLLAAAAVSFALGRGLDAGFILVVLALNATIGSVQEWKAEVHSRALLALLGGQAVAWRDGRRTALPAEALVPGDVVELESGQRVPADIRLLHAEHLLVDESLLTGEAAAVRKHAGVAVAVDAPLGDRATMLHAATSVQVGRVRGVVTATGRHTRMGRMAAALETPPTPPPLVRRMARFTRQVGALALVMIALLVAIELGRGVDAGQVFLLAVALAVSAIPEGLPVAMTVALSIATHRMARRNVLVRHLPAVEGLGACTLIATDKTGTLTLNRLTLEQVWRPGTGALPASDPRARPLLDAGCRASEPATRGESGITGDAVDLAFIDAALDVGVDGPALADGAVVARIPFEPELRLAATFRQLPDGLHAFAKGAPEAILPRCTGVPGDVADALDAMTAAGYRVLAVGSGPVVEVGEASLQGLRLDGLAGLIDPLRPEARDAVRRARNAGIRVVMVTGDHPRTAQAIATALGLGPRSPAGGPPHVVTGSQWQAGSRGGREMAQWADVDVFARTEPMQKQAIVQALQSAGHVVAVTGDGVNDAPALHAADIGVAMGRGGTDVARDAADLVLTDDNFASIVAGVEEGRTAYGNLRKVIALVISTGAAEIMLMLGATLTGLPPPLTAGQLLWLNLVTNGMQDVALAFEKGEPDVLAQPPRAANAPIFDRAMIEQVLLGGATMATLSFGLYAWALDQGIAHAAAQGLVLWLLVWCENAHCLNCRSERRSVFRIPLRDNRLLVAAILGTQALQVLVLAIPPLRAVLGLDGVSLATGLSLSAAALVPLAVMEAYKAWQRRVHPD
ncbi:MAG: hypothetical protein A2579_09200, partial [Lysobacterales bacterium RIFOXYD1_FULL_69_11]